MRLYVAISAETTYCKETEMTATTPAQSWSQIGGDVGVAPQFGAAQKRYVRPLKPHVIEMFTPTMECMASDAGPDGPLKLTVAPPRTASPWDASGSFKIAYSFVSKNADRGRRWVQRNVSLPRR